MCTSFWKFKIHAFLGQRCLPVQSTLLPHYTRKSRCCVSKATQLPPVFFNPKTTTTACRLFPNYHDCRARATNHRGWLVRLRGVPVLPEWSRWKAFSLKGAARSAEWNRWQKKTCDCIDSPFGGVQSFHCSLININQSADRSETRPAGCKTLTKTNEFHFKEAARG